MRDEGSEIHFIFFTGPSAISSARPPPRVMSSPSPTSSLPSRKEDGAQEQGSPMMADDDDEQDFHPAPAFVPDQKVWAREGGIHYEAVVRKASWQNEAWKFYIHYAGWNARWDKWLSKDDLLPDTPENRQRIQQETQAAQERQQRTIPSAASGSDRKRKKAHQTKSASSSKKQRQSPSAKTFRGRSLSSYCELPFTLKTIMIEDRERILRMGFDAPHGYDLPPHTNWRPAREVHHLPSAVPIKTVLSHFVQWKVKKDSAQESTARAFAEDVAALFDAALPVCLLYQPERAQYLSTRATLGSNRLSDLYGCEHLLRLFIRLPVLMKNHEDAGMGPMLAELLVLLQKNRQACFKAKYREPSDEELHTWEKALQHEKEPTGSCRMDE